MVPVVGGDPEACALRALRQAELRVTRSRLAVLVWLADHPHASAEAIGAGVRAAQVAISKQAVYDVLAACVDAGLVRRIQPAGHPARFECRVGDIHHHLVCTQCGRTEDIDCLTGDCPCLTPADDHGFSVEETEIVFWGLCPSCTVDDVRRKTEMLSQDRSNDATDSHHEHHEEVRQ